MTVTYQFIYQLSKQCDVITHNIYIYTQIDGWMDGWIDRYT